MEENILELKNDEVEEGWFYSKEINMVNYIFLAKQLEGAQIMKKEGKKQISKIFIYLDIIIYIIKYFPKKKNYFLK